MKNQVSPQSLKNKVRDIIRFNDEGNDCTAQEAHYQKQKEEVYINNDSDKEE